MNLEFAKQAHDIAMSEIPSVIFNPSNPWDVVTVSLYASMIEKMGSVLVLFTNDVDAGAESIFRSFLEAYVDVRNLLADPDYLDVCRYSYHEEWLKVLTESEKDNPFLAGLADHADYPKIIEDHRRQLDKLRERGVQRPTIFSRFQTAGMEAVYRSAYNFASAESHNNIRSLSDRHFQPKDGDGVSLQMYRGFSGADHEALLDSLCGILVEISVSLHDHFKTGRSAGFAEYKDRLEQARKAAWGTPAS